MVRRKLKSYFGIGCPPSGPCPGENSRMNEGDIFHHNPQAAQNLSDLDFADKAPLVYTVEQFCNRFYLKRLTSRDETRKLARGHSPLPCWEFASPLLFNAFANYVDTANFTE